MIIDLRFAMSHQRSTTMKRFIRLTLIVAFLATTVMLGSPKAAQAASYSASPNVSVPDNGCPTTQSSTISVSEAATVGSVTVSTTTTISHDDINFWLTSPSGKIISLHVGNGGAGSSNITVTSAAWNGEPASGNWTLSFCDHIGAFAGSVDTWTLKFQPSTCTLFTDGRLNSCDAGQTAAVYCAADGTVTVLAIWKGEGFPGIVATKAEIDAVPLHPAKNTLIKEGNGVRLYRLTSGKLQVNRASEKGKDYSFRFSCGG
jgi:subtilisin-like proprotein convertase family protein